MERQGTLTYSPDFVIGPQGKPMITEFMSSKFIIIFESFTTFITVELQDTLMNTDSKSCKIKIFFDLLTTFNTVEPQSNV